MINLADDAMTIKLDYELPEYPKFEEGYRRAPDLAPDRAARGRARRAAFPARQQGHVTHRRGTKPVSADAADLSGHPPRGGQRAQRGDGHERAHQARRHLLGDVVRVTLYK